MVAGMAAYQLYVVNSLDQARRLEDEEPVEFLQDDDQCASCGDTIGITGNKFLSCVVCIDENDDYLLVCTECASNVITPAQ
jgi:hypothetical protein